MENTDINSILTEAPINLYEMNTTRLKIHSKLTKEFQTTKGLIYGSCLPQIEPYKGGKGNVET
jgi:hypothetical protein